MAQVNAYYDLATPFYEYAWGQSFHFAPRDQGENYEAAIARYEHTMALRMEAKKVRQLLHSRSDSLPSYDSPSGCYRS